MMQRCSLQTGFSLLEVLIAIVVLTAGLLGLASLQVKSQQFNSHSYYSTQATVITHDMLERMRANIAGQQAGYYHLPVAQLVSSCYTTVGCNTQEMAQNDVYEWSGLGQTSIAEKLPQGKAVVCLDSTPNDGSPQSAECDGTGRIYAIKIWWQDTEPRQMITTAAF